MSGPDGRPFGERAAMSALAASPAPNSRDNPLTPTSR
ncbi:hypothetical protein HD595_005435 [Nonomuraea roseoviolacea subsp. carminata]|uniref:Uncharacterized protein n=1 Tax=Nonomuraea roseoviolacea subsp. carminata TaxID=160689 RepID=A0ABT1K5N4_9ACTN|nr:hypothetical protein [Nonomuraea roseoviolacea subsp. carminata]